MSTISRSAILRGIAFALPMWAFVLTSRSQTHTAGHGNGPWPDETPTPTRKVPTKNEELAKNQRDRAASLNNDADKAAGYAEVAEKRKEKYQQEADAEQARIDEYRERNKEINAEIARLLGSGDPNHQVPSLRSELTQNTSKISVSSSAKTIATEKALSASTEAFHYRQQEKSLRDQAGISASQALRLIENK